MNRSEHLLFGDRSVGKTMWLLNRLIEDIRQGEDAVYVAMTEAALDHARHILYRLSLWDRKRLERHTFSWEAWERARRGRHANIYIDDVDILLNRYMFPAVVGQETVLATFNVEWPLQAIVAPPFGAPPRLVKASPEAIPPGDMLQWGD